MRAMWHSDRGLEILKRAFSSCIYLNCQHSHFATLIFCMLFSNWPTLCHIFYSIGYSYLIVVWLIFLHEFAKSRWSWASFDLFILDDLINVGATCTFSHFCSIILFRSMHLNLYLVEFGYFPHFFFNEVSPFSILISFLSWFFIFLMVVVCMFVDNLFLLDIYTKFLIYCLSSTFI